MKMRQQMWQKSERDGAGFFVTLSTGSSLQGGFDYTLTLEDRMSREAASDLIGALTPDQVKRWSQNHSIETRCRWDW